VGCDFASFGSTNAYSFTNQIAVFIRGASETTVTGGITTVDASFFQTKKSTHALSMMLTTPSMTTTGYTHRVETLFVWGTVKKESTLVAIRFASVDLLTATGGRVADVLGRTCVVAGVTRCKSTWSLACTLFVTIAGAAVRMLCALDHFVALVRKAKM
jgi:hypothetical protein